MANAHQIGLMIRNNRESRGISQEYMADMLNIAQSAYAYIESGKTNLSVDRLMRITEILQMDIHQVIDESMYSTSYKPQSDLVKRNNHQTSNEAYELLIHELRNEIEFLRGLVKKEFNKEYNTELKNK